MNGRSARLLGTAVAVAALTGGLAACGGSGGAAGASAAPATPAVDPTTATCTSLLAIDAVPTPDGDPSAPPDPAAAKAWGNQVMPLLTSAIGTAPADLKTTLTSLQPVVQSAITDGKQAGPDDPVVVEGVAKYEGWAYQNCGYQQVSVMGVDFRFDGMPATLKAGPTAFQLMNHSAAGQFHVMLIARPKDQAMTLEQFTQLPMEQLMAAVDVLPQVAAAPPGQQGGVLVDLQPGRYFMVCPVGAEYNTAPHYLQGMINQVTVG